LQTPCLQETAKNKYFIKLEKLNSIIYDALKMITWCAQHRKACSSCNRPFSYATMTSDAPCLRS
jgi:hypothetical protein